MKGGFTEGRSPANQFFAWPIGFLGYDSWANWIWGDTIADRIRRERTKLRSFYETVNNPHEEVPVDPIEYDNLNCFWRMWAQLAVIKPMQFRIYLAAAFAFCGSPLWTDVLYGKSGARRYIDQVEKMRYIESRRDHLIR